MFKWLVKLLAFVVLLVINANENASNVSIMPYAEYQQIKHAIPYTFKLNRSDKCLFYFGANHSCDPNHPQFAQLEIFWQEFLNITNGKGCIVLVEGSKRNVKGTRLESITKAGGEGGLITFLAYHNGITRACPEPSIYEIHSLLKQHFSEEVIAYLHFAQAALQFHRYKKIQPQLDFAAYVEPYFLMYQTYFKLQLTLENLSKIHQDLFSTKFDALDEAFFYNITNPVTQDTIINKACRIASIFRDDYIVKYIENLMQQDKNIFIVYGCTHAVMQEGALRKLFS